MPLTVYKRRHTAECLEKLSQRIADGEIAPLSTEDLKQYRHCRCAWWLAEGTNDYGKKFTRRSLGVYTWEAACLELKKLNRPEVEAGTAGPIELTQAIEKWKAELSLKEASEGTILSYLTGVNQVVRYYESFNQSAKAAARLKLVSDLTPGHINTMRLEWVERGLQRSSHNLYLKFIKRFLKFCKRMGYITTNPAEKIETAPEKKKKRAGDDLEEDDYATLPLDREGTANYDRILAAAADFICQRGKRGPQRESGFARHPQNFVTLLRLMYETGLRVSDTVFFNVDRLRVDHKGGTYTTRQIKTNTNVTVFPSLELCRLLRSLPRLDGKHVFFDGRRKWKTFVNAHVRIPLQDLGTSLGIEGVRPHRFRDSFAVNELNLGTPITDLKDLLGHSTVAITEKYYSPWVQSRETHLRERTLSRRKKPTVITFPGKGKRRQIS